jgi:hypothetical protein
MPRTPVSHPVIQAAYRAYGADPDSVVTYRDHPILSNYRISPGSVFVFPAGANAGIGDRKVKILPIPASTDHAASATHRWSYPPPWWFAPVQ